MQTVITRDIDLCARLLLGSELVAFPTETVYGLGAIATDQLAVEKVYKVKNRPADNPLICHFYSFEQILEYATNVPNYVAYLVEAFSPGPISYILNIPEDSSLRIPDRIPDRIFRIPAQNQTLDLIKKINLPLAGPSSNLSGRPSHTNAQMVINELEGKIAGVLDGGESQIGLESTILECKSKHECRILRPGAIGKAELKQLFEKYNLDIAVIPYQGSLKQDIPGNKYPHYSPQTPVIKISLQDLTNNLSSLDKEKVVVLGMERVIEEFLEQTNLEGKIDTITIGHDLISYAHNLYNALQSIDRGNFAKAYLISDEWGNSSLAEALDNRLSKVGVEYKL